MESGLHCEDSLESAMHKLQGLNFFHFSLYTLSYS
jgi:hypothetical protein